MAIDIDKLNLAILVGKVFFLRKCTEKLQVIVSSLSRHIICIAFAALTVLSVSQYDLVVSSLVLVHIIFNAVRSS